MAQARLVGLVLVLLTLLIYLPTWQNGFIVYDDPEYVLENRVVQAGLTIEGVKWAFGGFHVSNWHPVTWLSHMLDCELFGVNAGPHHMVNVLFHIANVVFVFVLMLRLTGAMWAAALVAAFFGWHPLRVESVAWIAERKDVLSGFFGLLSLAAYAAYARNGRRSGYWLSLATFALGLMAKPMLVTLPFVLLLLDFWPLGRASQRTAGTWPRLVLEKAPFFLLTAGSCVVTFLAQREQAMMDFEQRPLPARLANAILSYGQYLAKTFWPRDLAVIYPLPHSMNWLAVAGTALTLGALTFFIWKSRRSRPYLFTGWFWFLGMLVPVIGLVQVGGQAMADRYTYLPSIGLWAAIVYLCRDVVAKLDPARAVPTLAAAVPLIAFAAVTIYQLKYWRTSETLFAHAVAVTGSNDIARINLGVALEEQGRREEALPHYLEALRINPRRPQVHNNIGNVLSSLGRREEALAHYRQALQLQPNAPLAHQNLGSLLVEMGRPEEAIQHYTEAARLAPDDPRPLFQRARARLRQGSPVQALDDLRQALRRDPNDFKILLFLVRLLASHEDSKVRNGAEAVTLGLHANALTGGEDPVTLDALAMAYAEAGRFDDARQTIQRAIDIIAAAGGKDELAALQQRLELYQQAQPFRESFK